MRMGAPGSRRRARVMLSTARVRTDAIRRSEPRDFNFSLAASRGCDPPQCRRWWTRRAVATRRFGRLTNLPRRGSFAAVPPNRSKDSGASSRSATGRVAKPASSFGGI
jgi:hypothetical protein